ncbi:MAG: alpha/beta hydrolase family protein [Arenimonas sp.]
MNKTLAGFAMVLFGLSPLYAGAQANTPIPLEQFLKRDVFGTMSISPTGEYFAATVPKDDGSSLVILRRADMAVTGKVVLPKNTYIVGFNWVNPQRILFSIGEKAGELEAPSGTGEIYGVNVDGKGQGNALIGSRSSASGSRYFGVSIISTLHDVDDFVLVNIRGEAGTSQVARMNVNTGKYVTVVKSPVRNGSFNVDPLGAVRLAVGAGSDNRSKTYYRASDKSEWELINDEAVTDKTVTSAGFSADGKTVYLESEEASGPNSVYVFNAETKAMKLLRTDNNVSPSGYLTSPVDGGLFGISYDDGKPRFDYIDAQNPFAKMHAGLQKSMSSQVLIPTSFTNDGNLAIVQGVADNVPGDFYLYDRSKNKLDYLLSKNSWFKPEMLAKMEPIYFVARDGTPIDGYLTVPVGSNGKNLPLIVNPHGGPFGPRDDWGYSGDVQILAANGYAVLQVNFRGSGGYGRKFMHMGYRQWGRTMQDDLTDATLWAIKEGIANKNRICMYGASYGGYSSIMAVAKEPDLYRCAFGNVGVYDMTAMYHTGDIPDSKSGENFLEEVLGHENLDSASPNKLVDRIKVPVYLAAGREDFRAAPKHTEMMYAALQKAGKPSEMVIYEGEGHGNFLLKNRIDFYQRLLGFLDKHIGPSSQKTKVN